MATRYQIVCLYVLDGLSSTEIIEHVQCSEVTIRKALRAYGITMDMAQTYRLLYMRKRQQIRAGSGVKRRRPHQEKLKQTKKPDAGEGIAKEQRGCLGCSGVFSDVPRAYGGRSFCPACRDARRQNPYDGLEAGWYGMSTTVKQTLRGERS